MEVACWPQVVGWSVALARWLLALKGLHRLHCRDLPLTLVLNCPAWLAQDSQAALCVRLVVHHWRRLARLF
jgi:hypothetical protein